MRIEQLAKKLRLPVTTLSESIRDLANRLLTRLPDKDWEPEIMECGGLRLKSGFATIELHSHVSGSHQPNPDLASEAIN